MHLWVVLVVVGRVDFLYTALSKRLLDGIFCQIIHYPRRLIGIAVGQVVLRSGSGSGRGGGSGDFVMFEFKLSLVFQVPYIFVDDGI